MPALCQRNVSIFGIKFVLLYNHFFLILPSFILGALAIEFTDNYILTVNSSFSILKPCLPACGIAAPK